jgi:hypothetical protein
MDGPPEEELPPLLPTSAWTAAGETRSAKEEDASNRLSARSTTDEAIGALRNSLDVCTKRKWHEQCTPLFNET